MKETLKKVDGYKTYIGLSLHSIWFLLNVIIKDLTSFNEMMTGHSIIFGWTGVGITHKAIKYIKNKKNE